MSPTEDRAVNPRLSRRQLLISSGAVLGVAATGGLGLAACASTSGGTTTGASKTSATLRYAEGGSFAALNPWYQEPVQSDLSNQVFSRLVYLDSAGRPVADLAKSWQLSADDMSLQVTLRKGLTWHDGTKVTGQDFVRMYGYLSDSAMASDIGVQKMTGLFAPVSSVTAPDDTTVLMKFKQPVPYIMDILSYWYLVNLDDPGDLTFLKHLPVGTGPFKMVSFNESTGARLEAFAGYHGAAPAASALQFDTFSSGTSLVNDVKSGLVDGVVVGDYADLKSIAGNSAYYTTRAQTGVWDLMVNCSKAPFNNVDVRQALAYSIDRGQIASAAFFGYEKPVATPFYNPASTGYLASLVDAYSFDLSKAKSLLKSAGVDSLTITFPCPTAYPEVQTLAEIWQSDLSKLGITLKIRPVASPEWESLITNSSTDVLIWNNGRCALDGAVFWSTQGNFLSGNADALGYQDSAQAGLIAQGLTETDTTKRKAIYQQLSQRLAASAHCIPIVTYSNTWVWSSSVKGPSADLIGNLQLARAS